jgi:hypothetical protein
MLQQRVLHADETPVTIMRMGENNKKPKRRLCLVYATTQYNPVQAVIYDFRIVVQVGMLKRSERLARPSGL